MSSYATWEWIRNSLCIKLKSTFVPPSWTKAELLSYYVRSDFDMWTNIFKHVSRNTPKAWWCKMRQLETQIIFTLSHWGRVKHICVSKLIIIGSNNGLSSGQRQAIVWNNIGIFLIGPLGTNFIEILVGIQTFSFRKMHLKMSSAL